VREIVFYGRDTADAVGINRLACGLIELDARGWVTRFLEKPPPDQVVTDLANGGVTVLEPGILDYVPPHTVYDCRRNLFPHGCWAKTLLCKDVFGAMAGS